MLIDAAPGKDQQHSTAQLQEGLQLGPRQLQGSLLKWPSTRMPVSASRSALQRQEDLQHMQQLYHLVPDNQSARADRLVVQQVDLEGHVLIVGGAASPSGMLAAIAPFRSKALQCWVPVVVLDHGAPSGEASGACGGRLPVSCLRYLLCGVGCRMSACLLCGIPCLRLGIAVAAGRQMHLQLKHTAARCVRMHASAASTARKRLHDTPGLGQDI